MVDFSKLNTIGDIKNVKKDDGNDVFTNEEKDYFDDYLIRGNVDNARKVAELLVRIKSALEKKVKNNGLLDDLEGEKNLELGGSVVYKVLNSKSLIRQTINYLSFLGRSDFPKRKDEKEKKIKEYEELIETKRGERADEDVSLIPFENELKSIAEQLTGEEENLRRRENLQKVIGGGDLTTLKVSGGGDDELLSNIDLSGKVNDYSTNLESTDKYIGGVGKANAKKLIDNAYNYLDSFEKTASPYYDQGWEKAEGGDNLFNNRAYFSRNTLEDNSDNIGYSFLLELRKIGTEKLDKLVENSGASASQQTKVKKFVREITEGYINWNEAIAGRKGYHSAREKDKEWDNKFDKWFEKILERGEGEFPIDPVPNGKHVFEFMGTVFPIDNSGKLISKSYYKPSDPNFIKSDDETNKGSSIRIKGYSSAPSGSNATKTIGWYSNQSGTPKIIKQELKTYLNVPKDWEFPSVVQLGGNVFFPFVDSSTGDGKQPGKETMIQFVQRNAQRQIRFCKTMREILLALGITSEISEVDNYLIEIASIAEKEHSNTGNAFNRKALENAIGGDIISSSSLLSTFVDKKFYAEGFKGKYKDYGKKLKSLILDSKNRVAYLKSKERGVNEQISLFTQKNFKLDREIEALKDKIRILKELTDFERKPLSDKKSDFETLYNKKDNQEGKGLLIEINQMLDYLELIKSEMDDDKFNSEGFKDKKEELERIKKSISEAVMNIGFEGQIYQDKAKDGLTSETIKDILKSKGDVEGRKKLEMIAGFFETLDDKILLDETQKDIKKQLAEAIADLSKYKDKPTSTLKIEELVDALKGTAELKNDDVSAQLDIGKGTVNFKEKAKIEALVKKYKPGSKETDQKVGEFKEHLKHEKGGGDWGGKKIEGDDYGEKFVKESPAFIIGAIKHYEWENDTEENKKKVKDEMEAANEGRSDDKKKKANPADDKKGNPEKAAHVAQFLYLKAESKSGEQLVKDVITAEDKPGTPPKPKEDSGDGDKKMTFAKEWFGFGSTGKSILSYSLIFLAVTGVGVAIFGKQIKEWGSGPAEEEGQIGEKTEEETESE